MDRVLGSSIKGSAVNGHVRPHLYGKKLKRKAKMVPKNSTDQQRVRESHKIVFSLLKCQEFKRESHVIHVYLHSVVPYKHYAQTGSTS